MRRIPVILILLAALGVANAQTTKSITTEIQGVVPTVFTLSTDISDIEKVDLVNSNSAYLGKVIVYTNTKGLWTIVIRSANSGKLTGRSQGNSDAYPYTMAFGTVDRIDLSTDFSMTYSTLIAKTTVEYPVVINYQKLSELAEPVVSDTYSDTVTITVTVS